MSAVSSVQEKHLTFINKLFEPITPQNDEDRKATVVALNKLLANQAYLEGCPSDLKKSLTLIYKGLTEPQVYESNPRFQLLFLLALRQKVEQKTREIELENNSCLIL